MFDFFLIKKLFSENILLFINFMIVNKIGMTVSIIFFDSNNVLEETILIT